MGSGWEHGLGRINEMGFLTPQEELDNLAQAFVDWMMLEMKPDIERLKLYKKMHNPKAKGKIATVKLSMGGKK